MAITAGSDILASDFISTSAGAGDSGKAPKLNGSGKLDRTFIQVGSLSDVTASRAFATNYQNTSGRDLWVMVSSGKSGGVANTILRGYVGASNPATTLVIQAAAANMTASDQKAGITFVVPSNYYYRVDGAGANITLDSWVEY